MSIKKSKEKEIIRNLNQEWSLWYDLQDKKYSNPENWSDNLQQILFVNNTDALWSIIVYIRRVGLFPVSSNLHWFRKGIEPMWEDKSNSSGGKWVLELPSGYDALQVWEDTLLLCSSEGILYKNVEDFLNNISLNLVQLDLRYTGVICGAVYSPRKNYTRISIWTSLKDKKIMKVGLFWKAAAKMPENFRINFKVHESAIKGGRETPDVYSM